MQTKYFVFISDHSSFLNEEVEAQEYKKAKKKIAQCPQVYMWQESKLEPRTDWKLGSSTMHPDIKLHETSSLHPERSQACNKTTPTLEVSSINFPNAILY